MDIIKRIESSSAAQTEREAESFAQQLGGDETIALFGGMGMGKTAFTRGFASYFGIFGVKSPTYTVVNEYRGGGVRIYHFDMYRITDGDDLYSIGYDDYVEADGFAIAEWSENVEEFLPEDAIFVTVSRVEGSTEKRKIEIAG